MVTSDEQERTTPVDYVTLSYRWGKADFFKLTLGSAESLKAGMPYNLLT